MLWLLFYTSMTCDYYAGVVKLVDAEDSKSSDPCGRVGSIPTSGTRNIKGLAIWMVSPVCLIVPKMGVVCPKLFISVIISVS